MTDSRADPGSRAEHWDSVYGSRSPDELSWYQAAPTVSLELIDAFSLPRTAAVVDIGGGASPLAERLVGLGFTDVTVLDISAAALEEARRRLTDGEPVSWLQVDVLSWRPQRSYDLWHDRALFHFLVGADDRARYLGVLRAALQPEGAVVIATFAPDAPPTCSGLPVVRYSPDGLARELGAEFETLEARREEHVTPRGVGQPFTWVAARRAPPAATGR